MLKKSRDFELTELLAIVAVLGILVALIAPNIVTAIQKSNQKNTMKNIAVISTAIIKNIKTGNRTLNESIQGIMGVNRAEKELAKSIGVLKERLTKTWRIKPWEKNVSNFNNSGRKKRPEYRRF